MIKFGGPSYSNIASVPRSPEGGGDPRIRELSSWGCMLWFSSLPNLSPPPAPKGGLPGARGRDSTVAVGSRSLFRGPPAEEGRTLPGAPLTSESPKPYVESVVALLSGSDGLAISKSTDSQAAAITSRQAGNDPPSGW